MRGLTVVCGLMILMPAVGGCGFADRIHLAGRTGGSAALFGQLQAFDGHSGRPLSFDEVLRRCEAADVVLFGEQHSDVVCNAYEAQLLHALIERRRPIALAMEFFETDTQSAIDAYLGGRIREAPFLLQSRQGREYLLSHRPMIEMCRAARVPVIAANAPRRLLREYRASGLPFDAFRATLSPEDQRWLPRTSAHLPGPYFERFLEAVKDHPPAATSPATTPSSGPTASQETVAASAPSKPSDRDALIASFRPMLLWDDSMAESMANFRAVFPGHRVMLIVGRFHVASEGGTLMKFRQRRPHDRICTLVYSGRPDGMFAIDQEDAGAADIVLSGITPPEKASAPATARATATASSPASQIVR